MTDPGDPADRPVQRVPAATDQVVPVVADDASDPVTEIPAVQEAARAAQSPRSIELIAPDPLAHRTLDLPESAERTVIRRRSIRSKLRLHAGLQALILLVVGGLALVSPVAAVIVAIVGVVVVVITADRVARSIIDPIREVGRVLRRFGDGDLRVRATSATDEVGTFARSFNVMAESTTARIGEYEELARHEAHLRTVTDALEMADTEAHVYRILEQSVALLAPASPSELLVADGGARIRSVAASPTAGAAGCPVASPDACPALRRAQTMSFAGPDEINACPQLVAHDRACSAVCVPVGANGHLLGVLHVTGRDGDLPKRPLVEQFVTLSGLIGARIGSIRSLESSRLEASTDGLTGLANRRRLEVAVDELLRDQVPFSLVMADIDHFKRLNDRFGHEVGDRALQLFAGVLQDNVRGHDIVARFGGEEFVLVYPRLPPQRAIEVLDRIRQALAAAIDKAGLPPFTTSFGVTNSAVADTIEDIVRVADAGLFAAKQAGRNRVVFADRALADEIFGANSTSPAQAKVIVDLTD